jgi:hypothetical protein
MGDDSPLFEQLSTVLNTELIYEIVKLILVAGVYIR